MKLEQRGAPHSVHPMGSSRLVAVMWKIQHLGHETIGKRAHPNPARIVYGRADGHFPPMLELTDKQKLRPETAREEIRRARRIKDNLTDWADEAALQRYIEELEAFLARAGH